MIELNENNEVSARDLHKLVIQEAKGGQKGEMFAHWIQRMLDYGFDEGIDYKIREYDYRGVEISKSDNQRVSKRDYFLTIDCAKSIAMLQRNDMGKKIRKYLIELDRDRTEGALLNIDEIGELTKYVRLMVYDLPRDFAKKKHFIAHADKYTFHSSRSKILGYSKKTLEKELSKLNERYKNEEQALMKLDKHELVRKAVIDLFIGLGAPTKRAQNMGRAAKKISENSNFNFGRWDDKMFKVDQKTKQDLKRLEL